MSSLRREQKNVGQIDVEPYICQQNHWGCCSITQEDNQRQLKPRNPNANHRQRSFQQTKIPASSSQQQQKRNPSLTIPLPAQLDAFPQQIQPYVPRSKRLRKVHTRA